MTTAKGLGLAFLMRLRQMGAPKWIIKTEQVKLVLIRKGIDYVPLGVGYELGAVQGALYLKHVIPLMNPRDHRDLKDLV